MSRNKTAQNIARRYMPKHLTGPSPSQKIRYANGPTTTARNKISKMKKHLKKQPNDLQTAAKLRTTK